MPCLASPFHRPHDQHYASSMVLQLQLAFSDVVQALDEAGKVAVNNIPRVLRDIDTVRCVVPLLTQQRKSYRPWPSSRSGAGSSACPRSTVCGIFKGRGLDRRLGDDVVHEHHYATDTMLRR